jgi:hypothetical protein
MRKFGWAIGFVSLYAACASAAPRVDPDWPCHQAKVADFPLASVWDGPPVATSAAWRADAEIAGMAAIMAQRRAPLADVQAGVTKLAAGPDGKPKVLQAFAAAFDDLVRQRAEILAGLERYGHKTHEMAAHIRAENETAHRETTPGAGPDEAAMQQLQWDLRIFEDRRRTATYVCEAPQAIEARIGEIVKLVRAAL